MSDELRAWTWGRAAMILLGINLAIVAATAAWLLMTDRSVMSSDAPGLLFAFAAHWLFAVVAGGVLYLGVAVMGAFFASLGLAAARRTPERRYASLNAIALGLHLAVPIMFGLVCLYVLI